MAVCNYQVFLSFRGPDTRDSLVAYLYDRLNRLGIAVFRDHEEIKLGASISATIVDAIKRSDVCVPVFSPDFASSAACLMEVAQMVESQKKILPIFFFVEPCEVRRQQGPYENSFAEHESQGNFPKSTIQKWRDALKEIACKKGPEFKNTDLGATVEAAMGQVEVGAISGPKPPEAAPAAALEASPLGDIGVIRKRKYEADDVEDALEAAPGKNCVTLKRECKKVHLGETSVRRGPEIEEAAPSPKAAMEFAQGRIGVRHTKGQFYMDLFNGFRELDDFVSKLWTLLTMDKQDVTKHLVGRDKDVRDMILELGFDYRDGQLVEKRKTIGRMVFVVWGIVGVGKTTLAKVVYNKIRHLFDGCSFLENVRGEIQNVVSLQNKLIRDLMKGGVQEVRSPAEGTTKIKHLFRENRVLIVLDNVDSLEQIKPLAEEFSWFGPRSIIMLTTTTEDIIEHYKDTEESNRENLRRCKYEVLGLQENHALELFNRHAIKPDDVSQEDNAALSKKIISALGHLPFAIECVGKYLCGKSKEIWKETPDQLRGEMHKRVVQILKENYDSLTENAKEIFLDIACFFVGVEKRNPYYMWVAQKRQPDTGVRELQNISFLKIGEKNEFLMHTPLTTFATEIVKDKCHEKPWQRSRLWDYEDLRETLQENEDIKKVNALRVTPNLNQNSEFNPFGWKELNGLPQLRFLDLGHADILVNNETDNVLRRLVWLDWHGCSDEKQLLALSMEKLVILDLCSSKVILSFEGWDTLMGKAKLLKVFNAKDCRSIFASLEFPNQVPLEHLILEDCLLDIPTDSISTSGLVNLVTLNMKRCKFNDYLPQEALCSLTALKELIVDETGIKQLIFMEGSLPALEILSACKCENLTDVESIKFLKNLQKLTLRSCRNLSELPTLIGNLDQLQEMDLSHTSIAKLPLFVKKLENLKVLKMVRTFLKEFPEAIKDLKKLTELDFTLCQDLKGPCIITGLISLRILRLKGTKIFEVSPKDALCILELGDRVPGQTAS